MKKGMFLVFFIFSFLFLSSNALAIGIGPSRLIIDFEPNYEDTITYTVINAEDILLRASLYVKGDLKDYITLSTTELVLDPGESKSFEVRLKLPAQISPGRHDIRIGASEAEPAGIGTVAALAAVEAQLWIDAPYPGKYIEVGFDATNAAVNEMVDFTLTVTNKGKQNLSSVSAAIDIYEKRSNEKVGDVDIAGKSVAVGDTVELEGRWKGTQVGAYRAVATVSYDGSTKTAEKEFKVGDLVVEILGIRAEDIRENSIGKISIDIDSLWNEDIENVYAEVDVNGEKMTSGPIVLGAWSNATLNVFWDTGGVSAGEYDADVTVHYAGKTATKKIILTVKPAQNIWMYALAIAIILALLFFIFRRKRKR